MRTTTWILAATAAAGLALVACTRQARVESGPNPAATDTVEGTVRQVGNTPFVRTVVRGEENSVTVSGAYEEEISNAVGARVRVWGPPSDGDGPGPHMDVEGYEILSVDGRSPSVGVLEHEAGEGYYLVTSGGDEVALAGVPSSLGGKVGAKIWVILGENGGLQRYGILREPEGS